MALNLTPNIVDPDGFYDELLSIHNGLTNDESDAVNARFILILANHVGNRDVLTEALLVAKNANEAHGSASHD